MTTKPCEQKKCELRGNGLCPVCSECGASPDVVSDACVNCWNCEHENGYVRTGMTNIKGLVNIDQLVADIIPQIMPKIIKEMESEIK